jgi:hypothetical protein
MNPLPSWIGGLGRSAIKGVRREVEVRAEICGRWGHSSWSPQNATHGQARITTNETTDLAGPMPPGTPSGHIADHLAARMSLDVARRRMSAAVVVASLNASRSSNREGDNEAQGGNR